MKQYTFCQECDFETEIIGSVIDLQHHLTNMEGAIVSDGEGGYISICPNCKEDGLVLEHY